MLSPLLGEREGPAKREGEGTAWPPTHLSARSFTPVTQYHRSVLILISKLVSKLCEIVIYLGIPDLNIALTMLLCLEHFLCYVKIFTRRGSCVFRHHRLPLRLPEISRPTLPTNPPISPTKARHKGMSFLGLSRQACGSDGNRRAGRRTLAARRARLNLYRGHGKPKSLGIH